MAEKPNAGLRKCKQKGLEETVFGNSNDLHLCLIKL